VHCLYRAGKEKHRAANVNAEAHAAALASLAFLNCAVTVSSVRYFDANKILLELAALMESSLRQERGEVAHLNIFLESLEGAGEFARTHITAVNRVPTLTHTLSEPIQIAKLMIDVRAEADPEVLDSAVNRAIVGLVEKSPELFARMESCEHYRPEM
jgi:hypothetical protein